MAGVDVRSAKEVLPSRRVAGVATFMSALFFLLAACSGTQQAAQVSSAETADGVNVVACSEPRPEMCAQIYLPVCGQHVDGTQQTYPNACDACAQASVTGYRDNRCEATAPAKSASPMLRLY